jgi:NADH dehydrogenase
MEIHIVTGAFGYSGKYIAHHLLESGYKVKTLTNSLKRNNPFGDKIETHPFNFDNREKLVESLRGGDVLYNTYWVRFNNKDFKHSEAVDNTLKLFEAAGQAGIKRIVHVSITNPSEQSELEYFRGKHRLEKALMDSGMSYAILRPTVLFGKEDILVNNIAWCLRKFPVFFVFGMGTYRLQPVYVDDLAGLAAEKGGENNNCIIDAIGPETFTYKELVTEIGRIIGKPRPVIPVPPYPAYLCSRIMGGLVGDVIITHDEIKGLMGDLLCTDSAPTGQTRLTEWAAQNAEVLGIKYSSELRRRSNRLESYEKL